MKVGAPFNPYRVFQGSFAPYWLLGHRGISAGAKICSIRLLGFAGKDARCYPSLETLGASLGVSDRQARDYVKELDRHGLIVVEQRGLRKTNVYLFVWTEELDRNSRSGQDRKPSSVPDRNDSSALDRKCPAGPIGINSSRINSLESSSSSAAIDVEAKKTRSAAESPEAIERRDEVADAIGDWAKQRGIRRLRSDQKIGFPESHLSDLWSRILGQWGVTGSDNVFCVLDAALDRANRLGDWRNWTFLTLQIQLAAERELTVLPTSLDPQIVAYKIPEENASCEWAKAKQKIRKRVGEVPFAKWFERTRQLECRSGPIVVAVPDEASRVFIEAEYRDAAKSVLENFGISDFQLTIARAPMTHEPEATHA